MSFDITSFLMGQAASGGGGGGGDKTLWTSGWIQKYSENVDADGNTVDLKSGSSHWFYIAPPATAYRDACFKANDTVKIAVTVKSVSYRATINMGNISNGTVSSASGVFTVPDASKSQCHASSTGSDVLTFNKSSGTGWITIEPRSNNGSYYADATATVEITGIEYNGTLIYGSV